MIGRLLVYALGVVSLLLLGAVLFAAALAGREIEDDDGPYDEELGDHELGVRHEPEPRDEAAVERMREAGAL